MTSKQRVGGIGGLVCLVALGAGMSRNATAQVSKAKAAPKAKVTPVAKPPQSKEAWLKGQGGGFSDPDQDIGPVHLAGSCTCDGNWWLRSFPLARHSLATLALSQEFSVVQRWDALPLSG